MLFFSFLSFFLFFSFSFFFRISSHNNYLIEIIESSKTKHYSLRCVLDKCIVTRAHRTCFDPRWRWYIARAVWNIIDLKIFHREMKKKTISRCKCNRLEIVMILFTVTSASEIIIVHRKLDFIFFLIFAWSLTCSFFIFAYLPLSLSPPSHAVSVRSSEWEK